LIQQDSSSAGFFEAWHASRKIKEMDSDYDQKSQAESKHECSAFCHDVIIPG